MNQSLTIEIDDITLEGHLVVPEDAKGLVIFSHGSGSSRFSPRNNFIAQQLQRKGLATFLPDLLTRKEDPLHRFNIKLLAERLVIITRYLQDEKDCMHLPIGFFGASTGAASSLVAAAVLKSEVKAVVSRGGRPDLAEEYIQKVSAPTLLIVGEFDGDVIQLNRIASEEFKVNRVLEIIPGATHLFEEPGALEKVAELSVKWFCRYLPQSVVTIKKSTVYE
jgi:putative phosphoribosyl transferase